MPNFPHTRGKYRRFLKRSKVFLSLVLLALKVLNELLDLLS